MPAFEEVIRLRMKEFSPEAARKHHIAIARQGLADFLARQDVKPDIALEVDGMPATSEESVKPFGIITYRIIRIKQVVLFALEEARRLSPRRSGRYRDSWFALAGHKEIDVEALPPGVPVTVTNDQPYSRKINVGADGFERYAPPGIVEKVTQLVKRRYGAIVDVRIDYLQLQGGYTLKRSQRRKGRRNFRSDALKGMALTYPALTIRPKFRSN
jgi:hypothetical protein